MGSSSNAPHIYASSYWASYLAESKPCRFPRFGTGADGPKRPMSLRVNLEHLKKLQQLSESDDASLPSLLRVAWGLLLRCYTGLDDVCFGYQEIGRSPVGNERPEISGPSNGMPVARFTVNEMLSVADTFEKAKGEYVSGLPFQISVPSGTTKDSCLSERELFDTAVVFRSFSNTATSNNTIITSQTLNVVLSEKVCTRAYPRRPNCPPSYSDTQVTVQDTPARQESQWQPHHFHGMVELPHVHGASSERCEHI